MPSCTVFTHGHLGFIDNTLPTLTQQVVSKGRLSFAAFEVIRMSAKVNFALVLSAKP